MQAHVSDAVTLALAAAADGTPRDDAAADLDELRGELEVIAREALHARQAGRGLAEVVHDPAFPTLVAFHQGLRDALLLELPEPVRGWVEGMAQADGSSEVGNVSRELVGLANAGAEGAPDAARELQQALAELLVFESVRLRLLIAAWSTPDFETLGGDERDVDAIAWEEVEAMLSDPALLHPEVRALPLLYASASVALARSASERVEELRNVGEDLREQLRMRARLRGALRELRLPESVLLENALANMLGESRQELTDLQAERPVALDGLSRQAMDQRVSRGRKALSRTQDAWPRRRNPALFDLLRDPG